MSRFAKWELTQQSTLCSGDIVHPAGAESTAGDFRAADQYESTDAEGASWRKGHGPPCVCRL